MTKNRALFCDDLWTGYTLQCESCGHTDNYVGRDNPKYPNPWVCKGCGKDMYYPEGASW